MANVIPSFRGFAATPDYAGSYLGGARLALQEQEQAQNIVAQRDRMAIERARLAQQAEETAVSAQVAQMRVAAQQQMAQEQALRRSTELDVEKAYNNARLGLQARALDHDENQLKAQVSQFQQRLKEQSAPSFQTRTTAEGIRSFNPQTGQLGEVVGTAPPRATPAPRIGQLDMAKYNAAQRVLADITNKKGWGAAQATIDEIDRKYSTDTPAAPANFRPAIGDLRQSESAPKKLTWDGKQRKLVPAQ